MSRVWVVGSINADTVLRVDHLPGAGETTTGELSSGLGGKGANQAVAAARAGAQVSFAGAVGDDSAGVDALAALRTEGVDVSHVTRVHGPTGSAYVIVDRHGENSIVVVPGANHRVDVATMSALPYGAGDVVVVQGELPMAVSRAAIGPARAASTRVIWNVAPADPAVVDVLHQVDVVVVNQVELATLAGEGPVASGVAELHQRGAGAVVATLGSAGLVAWRDGEIVSLPAATVDVVDTTGAGDCFVGVLVAHLAAGDAFDDAMSNAVVAAGLAVGRAGAAAAMPTAAEINQRRQR